MFIFIMRCLPIIVLITAFIWLYYLGTKAQQHTPGTKEVDPPAGCFNNVLISDWCFISAAEENKPTSAESKEDDKEDDKEPERETEAEKTEDDTNTI